ncbi:MAG TPA: hypothetical protein VJ692_14360 [Nitrospiraceae bacterium]|nr:hypothetical protein [Nitrospiraceae bacterium]
MTANESPALTLLYISDYFSFVGADGQGSVAFALDNNRGRDGDAFQAEHFVVLHDERIGWIDVAGNGSYDNTKQDLLRIPDSPYFQFEGTPATGLTISSPANTLTLRIDPIPQRQHRTHERSTLWLGSAPAVLTWQGRAIQGRVIYESLMMPDFNRLTRTYFGIWKEFQGFYLLTGKADDLYLHSQHSERLAPLVGMLTGFSVSNGQTESLDNLNFVELNHDMALGFYRWPTVWRVTWQGSKGPATAALRLSERQGIKNWVIGGFSMGIIRGELTYDGHTQPVYGLVELIM